MSLPCLRRANPSPTNCDALSPLPTDHGTPALPNRPKMPIGCVNHVPDTRPSSLRSILAAGEGGRVLATGGCFAEGSSMTFRVAIAGFGAIGKVVAQRLDQGIEGLTLTAVAARDVARAEAAMAGFARPVPVVPLAGLWEHADVVVECAPAALFRGLAEPALGNGRTVMVLSCGALLDNFDLVDLARRNGGRILVPTGALLGLDAVIAAAEGGISSVNMISRKPPQGLLGAPYLVAHGIEISGLTEPRRVFSGTAREAAHGFPANVNVAAALALAGIGPDPTITRNIHRIEIEAKAARLSMQVENVPSDDNPRTGRLTALSAIAALKKLVSPLAIGT